LTYFIGDTNSILNLAFSLINFLIYEKIGFDKSLGKPVFSLIISIASSFKHENGLSKTYAENLLSYNPVYNKAVTAPILLPHKANLVIYFLFLSYFIITFKSNASYQPKDINSPSELPQPAKSNDTTAISLGSSNSTILFASILFPVLQ